jgi:hypothetical protein
MAEWFFFAAHDCYCAVTPDNLIRAAHFFSSDSIYNLKSLTDVLRSILAAVAEPVANTPAEFAAQVHEEYKKMGELAKLYPLE